MSLEISLTANGYGVQRARLTGRLDTNTAPQLETTLEPIMAQTRMLVFDMTGLEYISSAGLRVIFKATKAVQQHGGRASLVHMQPQIRKVFDIVKAMPDVRIFENEDEMDEYLTAMQKQALDGDD